MLKEKSTQTNKVKKTRERILDASAALFSKQGYNGTALRDIASALDMKAGSLYYHFDSKEQLVLEILKIGLENIINTVITRVNALPEGSSTKEVLLEAAKGHLAALLEKGDYTSTSIRNYGQMPDAVQEEGRVLRDRYENMWRKWLVEAQNKGDIKASTDLKIFRLSLLGALNRTLAWYSPGGKSIDEIAEAQVGFFWDGIKS
ncbi:MAG: TetR/AcrR family transcriptional regulator [Cycloclasticus sp.]|jgi:AcrR family transcriptional regulator|nr:MAG: TetR family transcriptional regulator [Cycloclasticus sp. Phe_18]MBV1912173.1 TetR/AcrR family transcriptional regulator [Cycloclasticus sp.]MDF1687996.1 TetR/AcrR family transcriptional regulator [Cycloclasticus sp.]MEE4291270.1 TetR/AcrR family transcriptional regulator [Cycloclasticus sp.]